MQIAYNWLKDYINLTESPETVAERLTRSGLEVEGMEAFENIPGGLEGLIVGEVLECSQHPDADKLKLTKVNVGNGEPVQIVCGAPNVASGQKVVVALPGTWLYPSGHDPLKIKKSKIRGEKSEGMICAEDEIGLGDSHEGILELNTQWEPGTPLKEIFSVYRDTIFEIGLTPNRADAASHYGVARELKVLLNEPLQLPSVDNFKPDSQNLPIEVQINNTEGCPRYCGLTISGINVEESPQWLKNRLLSIGLNPINNIVDITNYTLHELGQPLHAFDADHIKGNKVIIDTLPENTVFTTLDGEERKLSAHDLMICDAEDPMCIAGVFGGLHSGVTENTTSIFLESAYFSPDYIRRTSQDHGLKTDASYRFERGTDPEMPPYALKRAALMIRELAGGEISSDVQDLYPNPVSPYEVDVNYQRIINLIGKTISKDQIKNILQLLDITIQEEHGDQMKLLVPPYRVDVYREADVVEEVLRIHGYDNIELQEYAGTGYLAQFPEKDKAKLTKTVSEMLSDNGFYEITTNSLTSPRFSEAMPFLNEQEDVPVLNRLSEDLGVLRQSLVLSGLEVILHNKNRKNTELKLFEFGKTYKRKGKGKFEEEEILGIFITGNRHEESWMAYDQSVTIYDLIQETDKIFRKLNCGEPEKIQEQHDMFQQNLEYRLQGQTIGRAGLLSPQVTKEADLKETPVFYTEIHFQKLFELYNNSLTYQEIPKFPEVRRDLSLLLDKETLYKEIEKIAWKNSNDLLKNINVFDTYEGENIEKGKKSYSLSFLFQNPGRTLTDEEVDKVMKDLISAFEKNLNATIR